MEEETEDQDEVGGLRMPDQGSNDADPVGGGEDLPMEVEKSKPIFKYQIMMMEALGIPITNHDRKSAYESINRVVDRIIEVLDATFTNRETNVPCTRYYYDRDISVALKRDIAIKKAIRYSSVYNNLPHFEKERHVWIDANSNEFDYDPYFTPIIETQKRIVEIVHDVLEEKIFKKLRCHDDEVARFKKEIESGNANECAGSPSSQSRFVVPTNQQTHSSSPPTPIVINNPASLPDTPKKPLQQVVYTSKKSVSKDKIGIGCLLEAIGIFVFFITFFTIVGPLVGLALFACGYAIARQKRYVCRNCGNSLAPESKICPSCSAVYVAGILQVLSKFLRVLLLIGLFFFVYALVTGKWEGIQKSAQDWIEDKWGGDDSTVKPNVNNDDQSDVTNEPEGELPEIEPTDLIAERDWTDIQGRTLTASLIDALKRPDGSYYGKFRKPDGSEFEYDVLKLSKPDRARIKNALVEEGRIQE